MLIERKLKTPYGGVHYLISEDLTADRITLFFLHGLTASHDLFKSRLDYFSDRYDILTWDAPAHGASRSYEDFTYEKAALATKQILDDNGIREAVFIRQIEWMSGLYPDKTGKVISYDRHWSEDLGVPITWI